MLGSLFLLKLWVFRSLTVSKRDFNTDIFWWILRNLWEHLFWRTRSSHQRCFLRKGVLPNFAKFIGNTRKQGLFLIKLPTLACNFSNEEALAQVFSCEFWEISKNRTEHQNIFYRTFLGDCFWKTSAKGCFCIFENCLVRTFFLSIVLFYETKMKGCSNWSVKINQKCFPS